MMILILVAAATLISILIYWSWRIWVGHSIGIHLALFEEQYAKAFQVTGSTKVALHEAFHVFRNCPKLNQLGAHDVARLVKATSQLKDPSRVVHALVMRVDSTKIVEAFRNEALLVEFAKIEASRADGGHHVG